jgi:hypothetical protein
MVINYLNARPSEVAEGEGTAQDDALLLALLAEDVCTATQGKRRSS